MGVVVTNGKHRGALRRAERPCILDFRADILGYLLNYSKDQIAHIGSFTIHNFCLDFQKCLLVVGDSLVASTKAQTLLRDKSKVETMKNRTQSSNFC